MASGAIQVTAAGGGGTGSAVTAADGALATEGTTTDVESASGNGTIVAILKRLRTLLAGGLPAALGGHGALVVEGVASGTAVPVSGTFFQGTQPVSGTFFQATQPVSLATNTPDVTDRAARLVGHVTVDSAPTTAVTGTFFQATQPVSLATNTPDVTDRAARLLGHVTVDSAPTTAVTGTFFQATQPVSIAGNQAVNVAQLAGTAASTGSRVTDAGVQSVFPAAPTAANILVGHQAQTATTAATTVITIPINRTWVGTITITTDVSQAAVTGTTAAQALGTITTTGASATPAAGTVATCESRVGVNTATIGGGAGASNSITVPMIVSAGATALATIALASTIAGTAGRVACTCSGYLV